MIRPAVFCRAPPLLRTRRRWSRRWGPYLLRVVPLFTSAKIYAGRSGQCCKSKPQPAGARGAAVDTPRVPVVVPAAFVATPRANDDNRPAFLERRTGACRLRVHIPRRGPNFVCAIGHWRVQRSLHKHAVCPYRRALEWVTPLVEATYEWGYKCDTRSASTDSSDGTCSKIGDSRRDLRRHPKVSSRMAQSPREAGAIIIASLR